MSFPGVGPGFRLNTETETDEYGLYGYGRLQVLDGLNLTLGARYAIYDSVREDTGRDTTVSDLSENRLVPLAGVSYDVTDDVTVYSSYSEIFQPQRAQTASGEQLDPIVGRQVEAGGKASFFDGDLTGNAAVYRLEDENRAIDDPANPGASIQAGDAVTKGFETFVAGRPYPGVDLTAGYSFVDTDLEADPSPEHTFTASGKYTFQSGALADLYLGAGVRAVSGSEVVRDNATIEADGYAVVNVFAGYRPVDGLEIQLFVNNLFNNDYVQRVNTTARGTFYGEPLSAMLRVSAKF
jgi:outer membrane receptor for ferric coprogen and ferric-rhodotorulic acid